MGARTFLIIMILIICVFTPSTIVMGDGTGDYPAPGVGDWIIANGTWISNEEIILEGDLRVLKNATLILNNVDLKINSSSSDIHGIFVEEGGILEVYNSNITNISGPYLITIQGNMTLESSTVSNMMYGIDLEYGGVYIGNCTITNDNQFNHYGIRVNGSALIYNNHIHSHKRGIVLNYGASPTIINNTITNNDYGILCIAFGFSEIIGNDISNNTYDGISVELGHFEIHNNTIASNGDFGIISDHASINSSNNLIYDNGRWGIFTWGAPLVMANNILVSDGKYNSEGDVLLDWDVFINVFDQNNEPLDNVNLTISDNLGEQIWSGNTIANVRTFVLREYEIVNGTTLLIHTPYTIDASLGDSSTSIVVDIKESQIVPVILEIEEEREVKEYEFPAWGIVVVFVIWAMVAFIIIIGLIMALRNNRRRRK